MYPGGPQDTKIVYLGSPQDTHFCVCWRTSGYTFLCILRLSAYTFLCILAALRIHIFVYRGGPQDTRFCVVIGAVVGVAVGCSSSSCWCCCRFLCVGGVQVGDRCGCWLLIRWVGGVWVLCLNLHGSYDSCRCCGLCASQLACAH